MHACVRCICNCLYTLRRDVLNILNKITLIHTVFHHMFCFVAHLCTSASNEQLTFVQPKSNEASFFFSFFLQSTYQPPPPPFQVVRSISIAIQITVLVMGYFKVWTGEKYFSMLNTQNVVFFFFLFLPSSKHDRNRNRKKELFQQYLILYTEKKLITWRQAFLGRQRGLGVFHCAHS